MTNLCEFIVTSIAAVEIVPKFPKGVALLLCLSVFGANGKAANKQNQFIGAVYVSAHSHVTCPTCNLNDQFFLPLASRLRKRIYLLASAR